MIQQHMRPTYHPSGKVRPITPSALVGLEVFAHRIPPEAELQPDLDVGTALSVELLSTTEIIIGEAPLAAGSLLSLAADSLHRRGRRADLPSDRSGGHAGGLQIEYLLLLRRADRTADRLANPRAVVVSLACSVGATLGVLDSGATSPAMRRLRKASRGSQLFELMLPRCTTRFLYELASYGSCLHHEGHGLGSCLMVESVRPAGWAFFGHRLFCVSGRLGQVQELAFHLVGGAIL